MAVFFFAAFAGFFFTAAVISIQEYLPTIQEYLLSRFSGRGRRRWEKRFLWVKKGSWPAVQLVAGVGIVYVLITSDTDTIYWLSKTKTLSAFFGFVFGAAVRFHVRTFFKPVAPPGEGGRPVPAKGSGGINGDGRSWWLSHTMRAGLLLLFLLFFGLLAPHSDTLFDRITRLATPLGEAEFAPLKARAELGLEEDLQEQKRYLYKARQFADLYKTRIEFDRDYWRYVGGASEEQLQAYLATEGFIETVIKPVVDCVEYVHEALATAGGIGGFREELRPFVGELRKVLFPTSDNAGALGNAGGTEGGLANNGLAAAVAAARAALSKHLNGECGAAMRKDSDIAKAESPATSNVEKAVWMGEPRDIERLRETPYMYMILGRLLFLMGDVDSAIQLLRKHADDFADSIQFNYLLGLFMYVDGRDAQVFLPYYAAALRTAENQLRELRIELAACQPRAGRLADQEKCERLQTVADNRYWATLLLKNSIAYQAALAMASKHTREGIGPWKRPAIKYGRELKELIEDGDFDEFANRLVKLKRRDDPDLKAQDFISQYKAAFLDTAAVVQLVHAATEGKGDREAIEEAREMLERALSYAELPGLKEHLYQADLLLGLQ